MSERFERRESVCFEQKGQQMFGMYHWPLHEEPVPALLYCHGFAGNKVGTGRLGVSQSSALVQEGIASLRIDFRCCGDSEGDFSDMTFQGMVEDAVSCLKALAQHPKVDASRIGILGVSLGGAVAAYAAAEVDFIRSMALWCPVAHPAQWQVHWPGAAEQLEDAEHILYDGEWVCRDFIVEFMHLRADERAGRLAHAPLLHIHGEDDEVLSMEHAESYEQHRKPLKQNDRFVRLPKADHAFSDPEIRKQLVEQTTEWFAQTL